MLHFGAAASRSMGVGAMAAILGGDWHRSAIMSDRSSDMVTVIEKPLPRLSLSQHVVSEVVLPANLPEDKVERTRLLASQPTLVQLTWKITLTCTVARGETA